MICLKYQANVDSASTGGCIKSRYEHQVNADEVLTHESTIQSMWMMQELMEVSSHCG